VPTTTAADGRGVDVRLARVAEALRSGLWFIPSVCVLASILLSLGMAALDRRLGGEDPAWLVLSRDPDVAQTVLSTIAGSTLTFTGALFSITVVALQLASSQFSPRVLRSFLRDRTNQWCLGVFLASFTYALLGLRAVRPGAPEGEAEVPGLTLTVAFVLVLASLAAFVLFVHHVTQSIRVVHIIDAVAAESRSTIRACLPDEPDAATALPDGPPARTLTFERGPGVVVTIAEARLVELATEHGATFVLRAGVGDHLASGVPLVDVHGGQADEVDPEAVLAHIGTGRERTAQQDIGSGLRQLADIAVKALSPGINDPTTATQCLDRLHDLLRRIGTGHLPSGHHVDADGNLRLVVPTIGWDDVVQLSFDEIRRYGAHSLQVHRRLRAVLVELVDATPTSLHPPLEEQLSLLDRAADGEDEPEDRARAKVADRQGIGSPAR
jgi:uncharacterized membrane protein